MLFLLFIFFVVIFVVVIVVVVVVPLGFRLAVVVVVVVVIVTIVVVVAVSFFLEAGHVVAAGLLWCRLLAGRLAREGELAWAGLGRDRSSRCGGEEQARAVLLLACVFFFSTCHRLAALEHVLLHLSHSLPELGVLALLASLAAQGLGDVAQLWLDCTLGVGWARETRHAGEAAWRFGGGGGVAVLCL